MGYSNHELDGRNLDLVPPSRTCAADYLKLLHGCYKSPLPNPSLSKVKLDDGRVITVVREDKLPAGSKSRMAHALVAHSKAKVFTYAQMKNGYAGISLAWACKELGRDCVLYIPETKHGKLSPHQQRCADLGALIIPHKIYGASGLRKAAREHAQDIPDGRYIDMGMRGEPLCTAALISACQSIKKSIGNPPEIWSVISTGQLTRSLQIAFPKSKPYGVAVARNIHKGEAGAITKNEATCGDDFPDMFNHPFEFNDDEDEDKQPPFPSAKNYDAKAWRYVVRYASHGALFWNVAGY
jgi:Pyridoxal-phosphate dependent enzyme